MESRRGVEDGDCVDDADGDASGYGAGSEWDEEEKEEDGDSCPWVAGFGL